MGNVINHPDHYQLPNGMEAIDIIEAVTANLTGIEAFDMGNALKYQMRFKNKNGIQDLRKADWYIQHLISVEERELKRQVDQVNAQFNGGMVNE